MADWPRILRLASSNTTQAHQNIMAAVAPNKALFELEPAVHEWDLVCLMNFSRLSEGKLYGGVELQASRLLEWLRRQSVAPPLDVRSFLGERDIWSTVVHSARSEVFLDNPMLLVAYPLAFIEDCFLDELERAFLEGCSDLRLANTCCGDRQCIQTCYYQALLRHICALTFQSEERCE